MPTQHERITALARHLSAETAARITADAQRDLDRLNRKIVDLAALDQSDPTTHAVLTRACAEHQAQQTHVTKLTAATAAMQAAAAQLASALIDD